MSNKRLELHKIFTDLLGTTGKDVTRVYFQPPSSSKMQYPCILYTRDSIAQKYANDEFYKGITGYTVTVIDPNPDSDIPSKIQKLPMCKFTRHYTADNLNHDVFVLYY